MAGDGSVTYSVQMPGAIATKAAVGDVLAADYKLIYEVYRAGEIDVLDAEPLYEGTTSFNGNVATIQLQFVKRQEYKVLFWAQADTLTLFNTTDLREVSMNSSWKGNDLAAAVFAGTDSVSDCVSANQGKVTLVRPVSQINIATSNESLTVGGADANQTSKAITMSTVTVAVKGLHTVYNVYNKEVSQAVQNVTFNEAEISKLPTEFNSEYKYVAMNYVGFAPTVGTDGNVGTVVELEFDILTSEGNIHHEVGSVPVVPNYRTNILGNLITEQNEYTVTIDTSWDGSDITYATDTQSVQAALDAAEDGTIIKLHPGVNYGTLYVRPVLGADHTESGDWFTGNYATELARTIENVTILGAEGATVDAIVFDAGYKGSNYIEGAPDLMNYINIKNLVIDGVNFTGVSDKPVFISLQNTNLDGLTVTNCTLNCETSGARSQNAISNAQLVYVYGSQGNHTFATSSKNIVISKNKVSGVLRLCELRETENVTITGNTINGAAEHAILLATNSGKTYSGSVTITDNDASSIGDRFLRMSGAGDASVLVKDNSVNHYFGEDVDYIKVSGGDNVTLVNNLLGAATAEELQSLICNAESDIVITLTDDIEGNVTVVQKPGVKITIEGAGKKYNGVIKVHSNSNHYANAALTIKNVNFETSVAGNNVIEALENGSERYSTNITVENCTFTATGDAVNTSVGVQIKSSKNAKVINCTATDMHSLIQAQSCDETVVVEDCTINGKNGVAFKQVKAATVEGTTITALEYGIRFDGNIDNYGIVVKNNNVTANQPLIVRKMTGKNNIIALEGENTLTTEAEYQVVITNGSDDETYVKPTGTYTLTGADSYTVFPTAFPVATWDEFTAALAAGEDWIKLTDNITYAKSYDLKKNVTLDLGGKSLEISDPALMLNVFSASTIKNGTIKGKVYARTSSNITFDGVTFGGSINGGGSIEASLQVQGACNVYAKNCSFNATNSNSTKSRPLSVQSTNSGTYKFEGCSFKSNTNQNQVYVNPLGGTATLDFTNCNFNNKTPNIMLAAACPFTSLTMTGTTKLSSVTLEINRAKDLVTDADLAYLREMIANNSFISVRVYYAGGSSEYIR